MKTYIVAMTILVSCVGCIGRSSLVNYTTFFDTHDVKAYFQSTLKAKGLNFVCVGSGGSHSGGSTGVKHEDISIHNDDKSLRDTLVSGYMNYVENELTKSGVTIHGRGVSGKVSGFDFTYDGSGVSGIVRVNSVVDIDGYIHIDVFIYEHGN